jgi:hypothetical protein
MSSILIAVLLCFVQFMTGFGVLTLCRIWLKPGMFISLAAMLGVAVSSFVPFVLELCFVPLTAANIFLVLAVTCLLVNLRFKQGRAQFSKILATSRFRLRLYEIPFLLVIGFIMFVSVWRCFYFPPTSRDFTSGAEAIAEYAVREKTLINSVFTVNLEKMNNHFKSPYLASLQVIYKYAGFPFGQIWLSNLFIFFIIFLYHALGLTLHRALAGLLTIAFLAIPQMYAYTFMGLFDYSNAVFFFLSAWFAHQFLATGGRKYIAFAGLLMGIATYIRSETLILAGLLFLGIAWHHVRKRHSFFKLVGSGCYFLLPSACIYLLTVYVYINFYLPVVYDIDGQVNANLLNPGPFFQRFMDINTWLIFSAKGVDYYGYFFFLFLAVFITDLIFNRKLEKVAANWLYAALVVYLGLALLGYLLPLLDLDNSTKRGMFKIFPLLLLYMGNSAVLINLSRRVESWEARA